MERKQRKCHKWLFAHIGLGLALWSGAIAGCGSGELPVAPVEGTVLYNGKPLTSGVVTFLPATGPVATGEIQSDGTFRLSTYGDGDGAVLGKHQVSIGSFRDPTKEEIAKAEGAEPLGSIPVTPQKYLTPATRGLTAEVKQQNEPFQFELRDGRRGKR